MQKSFSIFFIAILFYAFGQSKWAFSETQAICEQVGAFKFYFMKTIELQKMHLDELKSEELLKFDGGHGKGPLIGKRNDPVTLSAVAMRFQCNT